ncbi:MAG: ribonuclease R [Lachnospiraceae bacterium]|nr:ribonuclease R [Lachnospiraceae bacterium]
MEDLFFQRKKKIEQLINDPRYVPMKEKELAILMQVKPEDREELKRVLNALLAEGKVSLTKRGRYVKPEEKTLTGTFTAHAKGFGFVTVDGMEEDFFIPENRVHDAFHGDTVKIAVLSGRHGQREEAEIVEIVARGMTQIVGTFDPAKNFGFVVPDNPKIPCDIFVPKERSKGAVEGSKVVVEITDYGRENRNLEGKVVEILGHINDPGVDILSIIRSFDLPEGFSEKVLNQAERVVHDVTEADCAGRKDLRDVVMVTIDGEDAKDLDDAVSVSFDKELYHLGVHIADVTNYVQENSALDWEAKQRGTSVYLTDRVIPMLPHTLSNGICSLNAGVDRLALSCLMDIDKNGNVVNYEIAESVIRVDRRMSYTAVRAILEDHDEALCQEYEDLVPMFELMGELSALLRAKRKERGAVDFDFPESKITLDREGNPLSIAPYERNTATKLIEDFMLAANETVAQHFYWLELPFVYRTHDDPDPEKMEKLGLFLHNFGYHLKMGRGSSNMSSTRANRSSAKAGYEIHPKQLQKLLEQVDGTPEENMIARLTLRSMKRAAYTTECSGHFGLAAPYYCHFTSPIRRYPDLQIHRIIKEFLRGRMNGDRMEHYRAILPEVAKHSSLMERRADDAERETDKLKKVQYMEQHVGEIFEGVISGVTNWGFFVELPNTVEGLVHVNNLKGDYFYFDENKYELVGQMTSRSYKLGQKVTVKVDFADRFAKTIDFVLPEEWEYGERDTQTDSEQ